MPDTLSEKLRNQATLYTLDALTNGEREQFIKQLATNPELDALVRELQETLNLTRMATAIKPPEHVLQGQRNLLRGKIELLEAQAQQTSLRQRMANLWYNLSDRVYVPRQPVWAVATYVMLAFLIGRMAFPTVQTITTMAETPTQPDILQLLESGALSSADIDLQQFDPQSVSFNLKTKKDFNVEGGLNDEAIQQLLFYLLKNDSNPGKRMKAVNLISEARPVAEGKVVLISSLLTDPNPGVRLRAAKSLSTYESDKTLRDACVKVLFEDENEAVRMAVLGILGNNPTEDIVPALKIIAQMDKNEFIRDQARRVADTFSGQIAVERIED
ncbi:MAG: HEAT repeat domain-containing protein [Candidatus Neomarinimicrobiota bacterium]